MAGPEVPGRLAWIDDPENYTLAAGRLRIAEGGRVRTLPFSNSAFPEWDPSDRLLSFQTGAEMRVLASSGATTSLPMGCAGTSAFSPSGTQYVTVSADGLALELRSVATQRLELSLPVLESRPSDEDYPRIAFSPRWSPKGDRIAYTVERGLYRAELWTRQVDGSNALRVNPGLNEGWGAAWSPDGSRLAFYAEGGIWVVDSGGGGLRRLTPESLFAAFPSWSPDGTSLAFQNNSAENGADVWQIGADGSDPRLLVGGRGFQGQPAWAGR